MIKEDIQKDIINLFTDWCGEDYSQIFSLPESGSNRKYFRIISENHKAIGVYNADKKENEAFISFTKTFLKQKLNVPKIYSQNLNKDIYLLEDLGNNVFYEYLSETRNIKGFTKGLTDYYKKAIDHLLQFQINGGKNINYTKCYPVEAFDRQAIQWDLNYFKYNYLKLTFAPFNEKELEKDFNTLIEYVLGAESDFFMYRDFQSRNIMMHDDKLYFIDYQGGRKGALQYDLASLLLDAKADIPFNKREALYQYYVDELKNYKEVNTKQFRKYFDAFCLLRILQALGAYGYRGIFEKKSHFYQSIPNALRNLKHLIDNSTLKLKMKELYKVIDYIIAHDPSQKKAILNVHVFSFSYKRGIPNDDYGNGGGFVFDCRSLNNPGRLEGYETLTGYDHQVISFINNDKSSEKFIQSTFEMVDSAIDNYMERNFRNLMVSFGCTGGQHRSVYCANRLTEHLKAKYDIYIHLRHLEQETRPHLKRQCVSKEKLIQNNI